MGGNDAEGDQKEHYHAFIMFDKPMGKKCMYTLFSNKTGWPGHVASYYIPEGRTLAQAIQMYINYAAKNRLPFYAKNCHATMGPSNDPEPDEEDQ